MAIIATIDEQAWQEWVESRPPIIREMCAILPPDRLYRYKPTGHRVTLVSYFEDGTVKVSITGEYNKLVFDREVFGIKPEDLEECELPNDNELCGTLLTLKEDVEAFIHHIKNESHGH